MVWITPAPAAKHEARDHRFYRRPDALRTLPIYAGGDQALQDHDDSTIDYCRDLAWQPSLCLG